MDEQDVVDHVQVPEQDGTDQAVEVAAGDEAVALGSSRHGFTLSFHEERIMGWRSQVFVHNTLQN
jgi:hypothetical protein